MTTRVHLAIGPGEMISGLKKALHPKFEVRVWDSPSMMLESVGVSQGDVAIVTESWAEKNQAILGNRPFPYFIALLAPDRYVQMDEMIDRAVSLMEGGACECISTEMATKDIRGVVDFVLFQQMDRARRKSGKTRGWKIAASVLVTLLILVFGWTFHARKELLKEPTPYTEKFFHALTPSPSGIAVDGQRVWICDWYGQSITTYEVDEDLKLIGRFAFSGYAPMAIARGTHGLWSLSNDLHIRRHQINETLTVENTYKVDGANYAGLAWDGARLWSCDPNRKEIVRFELGETAKVIERFPVDAEKPIGLVIQKDRVWVMDGATGEILGYSWKGGEIKLTRTLTVPYFTKDMNRPAGFGGDNDSLWITADKSGLVYSMRPGHG